MRAPARSRWCSPPSRWRANPCCLRLNGRATIGSPGFAPAVTFERDTSPLAAENSPFSAGRRAALKSLAALAAAPWCATARAAPVSLTAGVARQQIVPAEYPRTEVWCYNGAVPAPELRFRQGDTARIAVANRLPRATTVHWHGLRVPNRMDGVPNVTQEVIPPNGGFTYRFRCEDSGTYWYHPHQSSFEQV